MMAYEQPLSERFRVQKNSFCAEYPLRDDFTAQVVIPRDMTAQEAVRMYHFIMSLAQPRQTP
jgi:hypothetical protein